MLTHRDIALLILRIPLTAMFVALLVWYVQYEFKRKVSFGRYWPWLGAAFVSLVVASAVFMISSGKTGDLILHAVGGGMMCAFIFVYMEKTYDLRPNWRVELILLFAFVSVLGVLNELAEYAYELFHLGIMSPDTHDTWRDLAANSFGAIVGWGMYRLIPRQHHRRATPGPRREKH